MRGGQVCRSWPFVVIHSFCQVRTLTRWFGRWINWACSFMETCHVVYLTIPEALWHYMTLNSSELCTERDFPSCIPGRVIIGEQYSMAHQRADLTISRHLLLIMT